jgi:hypothetical protein
MLAAPKRTVSRGNTGNYSRLIRRNTAISSPTQPVPTDPQAKRCRDILPASVQSLQKILFFSL